MKPRQTQGHMCEQCGSIYQDLFNAAACCASDRHPPVNCWRCYECGTLYASVNEADLCCRGDVE